MLKLTDHLFPLRTLTVSRPCRRCINLGKTDTCVDVQHKKRGRPRLRDREAAAAANDINEKGHSTSHRRGDQQGQAMRTMSDRQYRMSGSETSSSASAMKIPARPTEMTSYFPPPPPPPSSSATSYDRPALYHSGSYSSIESEGHKRSISSNALIRQGGMTDSIRRDDGPLTVSLILSTDLHCARCSEESYALLGYTPSDLSERSLSEIVHPSERERLESLWISLIEPVRVQPQRIPASINSILSLSPAILMTPAPGTVYMQESMRLRQRSGIYDFYSIRLHLGGGLGADLYQSSTLDRCYIVASLLKLGNDANHPDPNLLREGKWHLDNDPRIFTTPLTRRSSASKASGGVNLQVNREILGPPSAPPSYHSTSLSNEEHSRRGSLAWDQQQQHSSQQTPASHHQIEGGQAYLAAPPVYSRTTSSHSVTAQIDHRRHSQATELKEKLPRSSHETPASTISPTSHLVSNGNNTDASSNGNRITSMPFSYTSTRSESGGIIC